MNIIVIDIVIIIGDGGAEVREGEPVIERLSVWIPTVTSKMWVRGYSPKYGVYCLWSCGCLKCSSCYKMPSLDKKTTILTCFSVYWICIMSFPRWISLVSLFMVQYVIMPPFSCDSLQPLEDCGWLWRSFHDGCNRRRGVSGDQGLSKRPCCKFKMSACWLVFF